MVALAGPGFWSWLLPGLGGDVDEVVVCGAGVGSGAGWSRLRVEVRCGLGQVLVAVGVGIEVSWLRQSGPVSGEDWLVRD